MQGEEALAGGGVQANSSKVVLRKQRLCKRHRTRVPLRRCSAALHHAQPRPQPLTLPCTAPGGQGLRWAPLPRSRVSGCRKDPPRAAAPLQTKGMQEH